MSNGTRLNISKFKVFFDTVKLLFPLAVLPFLFSRTIESAFVSIFFLLVGSIFILLTFPGVFTRIYFSETGLCIDGEKFEWELISKFEVIRYKMIPGFRLYEVTGAIRRKSIALPRAKYINNFDSVMIDGDLPGVSDWWIE